MNRAVIVLAAFALASAAHAQTYPVKPVTLVVPFAPGGTSEVVARLLAAEMSKGLGQQMIVENKAGGAGNIAMQEVARAELDGYTLILGVVGTLAVNPFMFAKLPYDVDRDFAPISLLAKVPNIFVVNSNVPAKDLKEFVALAKANPGKLTYGSAGNGSVSHLVFEYLKLVAGIDVVHVPYKGTGPQITDLIGGRIDASSAGTPTLLPHVRSGKVRAIAVGTPQRLPALPDTPTVIEQGYMGFETTRWYRLMAPARTPQPVIRRLADEAVNATNAAAVKKGFADDGAIAFGSTPAEFAAFIKQEQEQARWGEVVKKANLKAD